MSELTAHRSALVKHWSTSFKQLQQSMLAVSQAVNIPAFLIDVLHGDTTHCHYYAFNACEAG